MRFLLFMLLNPTRIKRNIPCNLMIVLALFEIDPMLPPAKLVPTYFSIYDLSRTKNSFFLWDTET